MTDPDIPFVVARLLEQSPATAEQLWLKGCQAGFEKSLKTYRRAIHMLYNYGIPLNRHSQCYTLVQGKPYLESAVALFKHLLESKSSWRSVVYGDIDRKTSLVFMRETLPCRISVGSAISRCGITTNEFSRRPPTSRHTRSMCECVPRRETFAPLVE